MSVFKRTKAVTTAQTSNRNATCTYVALFLALIVDTMGMGLVLPVLGPLFTGHSFSFFPAYITPGARDILYGLTLASFCMAMFIGAPILGSLSDRMGRKKVLLLCLYISSLGLAVSAIAIIAKSLILLILGRTITGFVCGSEALAEAAIIDISTPKNKAVNLSLISLASCIGFSLGPALSGYLAHSVTSAKISLSLPFWIASLFASFNASVLLVTFKETFSPESTVKKNLKRKLKVSTSLFKNQDLKKLITIYFLIEFGWALYYQCIPLNLIKIYHYNINQIGHFMAFMGILFIVAFLGIGRIVSAYLDQNKIAYYSSIVAGIGVFGTLFRGTGFVWCNTIPVCIGGALLYIAFLTLFSNAGNKYTQGWMMGIFTATTAISWSLSGLFSGILTMLNIHLPFMAAGLIIITGAILFRIINCSAYTKNLLLLTY